jgi:hypothetical protein
MHCCAPVYRILPRVLRRRRRAARAAAFSSAGVHWRGLLGHPRRSRVSQGREVGVGAIADVSEELRRLVAEIRLRSPRPSAPVDVDRSPWRRVVGDDHLGRRVDRTRNARASPTDRSHSLRTCANSPARALRWRCGGAKTKARCDGSEKI